MKVSTAALSSVMAATAATTSIAFSPASFLSKNTLTQKSETALYFLDTSGTAKDQESEISNPVTDIQSYIPSPEPVEIRSITGTCLVSSPGSKIYPDLFYLLNHEDSAFAFDKIVAISQDTASTKKQLLTRQARYTGLLNKLDYAASESGIPSAELLEGASSWVAVIDSLGDLTAMSSYVDKVENVSILYTKRSFDLSEDIQTAIEGLQAVNPNASVVIVDSGKLEEQEEDPLVVEGRETKPLPPISFYQDFSATTEETYDTEGVVDPAFLQEEALRMTTECLQLQAASGKVLSLNLVENDSSQLADTTMTLQQIFPILVKGLRQAGYERAQEIDFILQNGLVDYSKAIKAFEQVNPTAEKGVVHTNAWWEDENFQKMVKKSSLRQDELIAANRAREEFLLEQEQEEKVA